MTAVGRDFGIKAQNPQQPESYFKRVWKIEDESGKEFIVKLFVDQTEQDLKHHEVEIAVASKINSKMHSLQSVRFIPDKSGTVLHRVNAGHNNYYVLMDAHPIITKTELTSDEQRNLGKVMAEMHHALKDFHHKGLTLATYMRDVSEKDMDIIRSEFPDGGYESYIKYMKPLDYKELGLTLTTIQGDWHQQNMSFTQPLFLFDLDTVSRGAGVEEIARTLTHWGIKPEEIKDFYTNLTEGYGLPEHEKQLVAPLMIAQLYRKYAEFNEYNDTQSKDEVKRKIAVVKEDFDLP